MKRAIPYFVILLFVAAIAVSCSKSLPSSFSAKREVTIMSYNIHHANPPSKEEAGEIDIDAIVAAIRKQNPDLVALQEVDVNTGRAGKVNQAVAIAEKLGMKAFFGRAIDYDGGQYGVAILSRYPLTEATVTPLPEDADPMAEDRVIATAKVELPGGLVVRFGSTHLDVRSTENRDQQVRAINEIAANEPIPFIVAGDFNAMPESSSIAELDKVFTRTCDTDCEPTIPVINPKRAIDFIAFTKDAPFKVVSQKVIPETYASDHLPVVATLSY
ncbi:endonuclease/exonuclease/phosphatase family protein [uncultured Pontibacter sp.]|uniref:endonuclease/exonuclease/phosphatase family protein n=1 Tax=uncultured Pontibacter sp. TaxID=453356 RepID=UPI002627B486|nr:endonuclease/exonuclease/phosphatase family protein [uncultured Pontibacter sp.]